MLRRLAVTVAVPLALAGGASGNSADARPVSVTTFVITGHGYGHGVGMAQWGAYGYAKSGFTYDRILAHYYPGTQLAPAPVTSVRVLLAEAQRQLTISSAAPFRVRDASGAVRSLPAGSYSLGPKLALTEAAAPAGPLVFLPGRAPLELGRPYRGTIEVSASGGMLSAVNTVGLDEYVQGVVSQEMPKEWPLAALEAQAVAARSYAISQRRGGSFDMYADTRDQVYGGIDAETPSTNDAVAGTKGQVLEAGGKVAATFFFSSSGGRTASLPDAFPDARPVSYLVSVADPFDTMSPWHDWGPVVLSGAQVSKALRVAGVTDLVASPAVGHARTVSVSGAAGPVTLPASTVRFALDLRSTWFKVVALTLTRPPGAAAAGGNVVLSGSANGAPGVRLEQRAPGGEWSAGTAVQVSADGSFSVAVAPPATTEYRLVAGAAASLPLRVPVSAGA